MNRLLQVVLLGLVAGTLGGVTGCSPSLKAADAGAPKLTPIEPALAARARAVRVFHGSDGRAAGWDELVAAVADTDAAMIGENHGHPLGLAFGAELWADVLARRERAVLSMEFFNRDEQARVDDYLAGLVDEAAFLKATRRTTDAAYPPGHRAMIQAAKAGSRPVIASNAPRTYVSTASRASYERLASLTDEQRRLFRIPDELPGGRYRTDYDAIMSDPAMASHGGPPKEETPEQLKKRLDSGFRAQSLWDWTMAESIARSIDRAGHPVVHVVGRFHSDFSGGLVQALEKLRPGTRVVIVSVVDASSETLRDADRGRGDFVVYVGPDKD
jgi:uncharacterized iron-regulated protein